MDCSVKSEDCSHGISISIQQTIRSDQSAEGRQCQDNYRQPIESNVMFMKLTRRANESYIPKQPVLSHKLD